MKKNKFLLNNLMYKLKIINNNNKVNQQKSKIFKALKNLFMNLNKKLILYNYLLYNII